MFGSLNVLDGTKLRAIDKCGTVDANVDCVADCEDSMKPEWVHEKDGDCVVFDGNLLNDGLKN